MTHSYLDNVAELINKRNVVAFIGAGVSATYTSESGLSHKGLPTAAELVNLLCEKKKKYLTPNMSLEEASYLYKHHEGEPELLKFLEDNFNKPKMAPLPAHNYLAALPFNAYISMNFDTLLESAIEKQGKKGRVIVYDDDIPLLRPNEISIIKPHGCITKPRTIKIARDDMQPILQKSPIIDAYLKTILAAKTVLFLGFSLGDEDFKLLFLQIKLALGNMMPKSYAITHSNSDFLKLYWADQNVILINDDLTKSLSRLTIMLASEDQSNVSLIDENKLNNPFFDSIIKFRYLASEAQIIDSCIEKLLLEIQENIIDFPKIIYSLKEAVNIILNTRKSFENFKNMSIYWIQLLENEEKEEIENILEELKSDRQKLSNMFKLKGKTFLKRNDVILLHSQSSRVVELLKGVPNYIQETCKIYISECRAKSVDFSSFKDALSLLIKLKETKFEFYLVPDTVIGHLISEKIVNKVILGANTLFINDKQKYTKFVNTSGSLIISKFCKEYKVDLYVVAETAKQKLENKSNKGIFKPVFEMQPIKTNDPSLIEFINENNQINVVNITYDLVPAHPFTTFVTELE